MDEAQREAELMALRFALACVVELLPDDRRIAIRETLDKFAKGIESPLMEVQNYHLEWALREIVKAIDDVHARITRLTRSPS